MQRIAVALLVAAALIACQSAAPATPTPPAPSTPVPTEGPTLTPPASAAVATPSAEATPNSPSPMLGATPSPTVIPPTVPPSATAPLATEGLIVDWRAVPDPGLGSAGRIISSAAPGSRLVVVGEQDDFLPAIWTSGDGRRWQAADFADSDNEELRLVDVVAAGPGFIAPAVTFNFGFETSTDSAVYASADGRNWTRHDPAGLARS